MSLVGERKNDLRCATFNQDYSCAVGAAACGCMTVGMSSPRLALRCLCNRCIAIGTVQGFRLFNCDPLNVCMSDGSCEEPRAGAPARVPPLMRRVHAASGSVGVVAMLFSTSLVALSGSGESPAFSPRRIQMRNTKRGTMICDMNFSNTVLGIHVRCPMLPVTA